MTTDRIQILDQSGKPVAGVRVRREAIANGRIVPGTQVYTSDAKGRIDAKDVPLGVSIIWQALFDDRVREGKTKGGAISHKRFTVLDASVRPLYVTVAKVADGAGVTPRAKLYAILSRHDTPAITLPLAREVGITGYRDYWTMDWQGGRLKDPEAKIASLLRWTDAGFDALVTLALPLTKNRTGPMATDWRGVARDMKQGGVPLSTPIEVGNEPNHGERGIGAGNADTLAYMKQVGLPLAEALREEGFTNLISPCPTTQSTGHIQAIYAVWQTIVPVDLFAAIGGHNYDNTLAGFDAVNACYRTIADNWGAKYICSEGGSLVGRNGQPSLSMASYAKLLPGMIESIHRHCHGFALYPCGTFDANHHALWDARTGETTDAFRAIKR